MRTAAECAAQAEDLEKRALEGPEDLRPSWLEMAASWRRLAKVAADQEGPASDL